MRLFPGASLLVVACLSAAGCGRGSSPRPILIGHFAPASGPDKVLGDHARQAIRLAMEEITQEKFAINGRPVEVLHPVYAVDDPSRLQPVAIRVLTVDQASALLGGQDLEQVHLLSRLAEPHSTVLVTPVELPGERPAENGYSVNVGLDFEAKALSQFARRELKAERIAILSENRRPASLALAAAFNRELAADKTSVVLSLNAKRGVDFPEVLESLKNKPVQALLYCGAISDLPRVRAKLQAAGLKPALLVAGAGEELELLRADREVGQGVYAATPFVADSGIPESQAFARKYQEKFGEPADTAAALAYDGLRALVEALRRAADPSPEKIGLALGKVVALSKVDAETPLPGLTGPYTFSRSHAARRPLFVVQIEDGQLRRPKRYDPQPQD
jgi:branched-chain amino acid transport system substrate-binding protein